MSQRLLKFSTIFLILIYAFAPQTLGITVSSSTQAAGKITSLSESLDLDGSTLLHESQSLGSGRILLDRQAEGYGDNRLKQSLSGTGYAVQNNIDSQGEFKASTSTLASAEGASVNQYVGGVGSLSLDLQGREEATDASQGADVAGGSLVSSQSLSTGQGVSASQRTEIEGLEGNILAGAMGTEKVMIARGSFEGRGSITADLDANTLNQGSTKGTVYLDDVALLNDDSFEAVSSDDEIQGMGLAGLRMVEGDLGSFDVSVINYDLDDLNRESYASKNDGASTAGGSASSYALTDFRWTKKDPEIQMYLNPTNIPSGIKDEAARDAIIAAANTWDDAIAQDIFADESTVVIDYSKEVPNFFGGNMRSDGFNVHGFKNFGNSYLAMTSYWTNGKIVDGKRPILESDIIYNLDYKWTEDLKQAEKTDKLDLQSVAVHELGHTIGLDDLYALSNGDARKKDFDQVMNLYNGPQRELGNGDKAGAQELYGKPEITSDVSKKMALQAYNGQYASAENGGGSSLVANKDWINEWELFGLVDLGENKVALRAANGQYVCAENGGNSNLVANRDWILAWETFGLIDMGDNKIALQAVNGKYVCAENGGGSNLIANRDWIQGWETFGYQIIEPS